MPRNKDSDCLTVGGTGEWTSDEKRRVEIAQCFINAMGEHEAYRRHMHGLVMKFAAVASAPDGCERIPYLATEQRLATARLWGDELAIGSEWVARGAVLVTVDAFERTDPELLKYPFGHSPLDAINDATGTMEILIRLPVWRPKVKEQTRDTYLKKTLELCRQALGEHCDRMESEVHKLKEAGAIIQKPQSVPKNAFLWAVDHRIGRLRFNQIATQHNAKEPVVRKWVRSIEKDLDLAPLSDNDLKPSTRHIRQTV